MSKECVNAANFLYASSNLDFTVVKSLDLRISAKKYLKYNFYVIPLLFAINLFFSLCVYIFDEEIIKNILLIFDFASERNIPTLYAGVNLLLSSLLLLFISLFTKLGKKSSIYFNLLSITFVFLCCDELFMIHEVLGPLLREVFNPTGIFFHAWIIPYGIGTFIFGLIYIRFINRLPREISRLFYVSGLIYVVAELGFELIAGFISTSGISNTFPVFYYLVSSTEEVLAMIGITIFNYSLIKLIRLEYKVIKIDMIS